MIVHLNGKLVPIAEASISPLDRGFLFGDGVYEGLRSIPWPNEHGRRIIGVRRHVERMRRGLKLARIEHDPGDMDPLSIELLAANELTDAFVYWQVTRGTPGEGDPPRSRVPGVNTRPSIFGYCAPQPAFESFDKGPPQRTAISCTDSRWALGHLKSISLMGNVLAALEADSKRQDDAIFIRNGLVAEGLATNVVLAIPDNGDQAALVTPSLESVPMLAGVTRDVLLSVSPEIAQRPVRVEELLTAREVMIIGTTTMVTSIVELDGKPVGSGRPGPQAAKLLARLLEAIRHRRDD